MTALVLAACVSSGPESQLGKEDKSKQRIQMTRTSDCVYQSTIDGFNALDDTTSSSSAWASARPTSPS
jgi:hypothetical protein